MPDNEIHKLLDCHGDCDTILIHPPKLEPMPPTDTCPHCFTTSCGSRVLPDGSFVQTAKCKRRAPAAMANRIGQLTERLAAATAANKKLRDGVTAWIEVQRHNIVHDDMEVARWLTDNDDLDELAALAAGEE